MVTYTTLQDTLDLLFFFDSVDELTTIISLFIVIENEKQYKEISSTDARDKERETSLSATYGISSHHKYDAQNHVDLGGYK